MHAVHQEERLHGLAEIMENRGEIIACDIHNSRIKLVDENAKRLGITIINTKIEDATNFNEEYIEKFDKILIDVPCLGIGVMKRKPDIKWQRKQEDIEKITKIQSEILENSVKYLKKGGELVYSTCSILKSENEDIINNFINTLNVEEGRDKNKFVIEEQKKINPTKNSDGFFMCKIKRIT